MKEASLTEKAGESYGYLKEYVSLQKDYLRLEVAERTGKILSALITVAVIGFIALLIWLLISLTAAIYIGTLINSLAGGFLIISGLYLLIGVFLFAFRKSLIASPIISLVIKEFFD